MSRALKFVTLGCLVAVVLVILLLAKPVPISVAAMTAAATTSPIESATDIIGDWGWWSQTASLHLQFRPDGQYRADESWAGLNSTSPQDQGTYQLRAGVLTWTSSETTRLCRPGDVVVYQIYLTATGQLALVLQQDACTIRKLPSSWPQLFDPVRADGVALAFPTGIFVAGSFSMTFGVDGAFRLGSANGQVIAAGTYAVRGETLRWVTDSRCGTSATYGWVYNNERLTFALIGEDLCVDRQRALGAVYSRQAGKARPSGMPKGIGVAWHLVVISESSGGGLARAFAKLIERDTGVKVTVDDFALGDLSAGEVLQGMEPGAVASRLKELPAALKKADIVVMFANPMDSVGPNARQSIASCFSSVAPAPCDDKGFEPYAADLKAIWAKVLDLRAGQPTILRAIDVANPFVSAWKERHVFDTCTACWECVSAAVRRAAGAFRIPVLSRYDVFNGVKHDEDPEQKGYIGPDGIHPSGLAVQYTAELLARLGYEPTVLP